MRPGRRHLGVHAVLIFGAFLMALPFLWMISTSLMTPSEAKARPIRLLPASPRGENYVQAWQAAPFGRYFFNTFLTAGLVTIGVLFTSILAGYAFGRLRFRGRRLLFLLFMMTMMIPFEVIMIPNMLIIHRLGWYDTYAALVVPWTANVFSIFMLRQFFASLPRDYFEAAQLDGCGHWRFLWHVAVPMVSPALVTVGIFAFLGSWNSLLWPIICTNSESMRVLQFGLSIFMMEEETQTNLLMAASTFAMLPIMLGYIFFQRRFIEGVAAGGLKE